MKLASVLSLLFLSLAHFAHAANIKNELWKADLSTLHEHLELNHPDLYHAVDKQSLEASFLSASEETTKEKQYLALAKTLAMIGDGHTLAPLVNLPLDMGIGFKYLPMQLKSFSDGFYVIAAAKQYQYLIGARLVEISDKPIEDILPLVYRLISSDNESWAQDLAAYYLSNLQVLNWVTQSSFEGSSGFTFQSRDGKVAYEPFENVHYLDAVNWISDFFIKPERTDEWVNQIPDSPLFNCRKNYCREKVQNGKTMYVTIRAQTDDSEAFADFVEATFVQIDELEIETLILDIRLNRGGNGDLRWPLIYKLINHRLNEENKLAVLISPKVFSAGMMLAVDLEKHTNATLIGQKTGSSPNHYGETTFFELPNSKMKIIHAGLYWQNGRPDDNRKWIEPDIEISNSSDLFFQNTDEAYAVAKQFFSPNEVSFDASRSSAGKALIYEKSNLDGSNTGKIAVYYRDGYTIESFKWHEGNDQASLVKAGLDPVTLLVSTFDSFRVYSNGEEKHLANLTANDNYSLEINFGNQNQTFKTLGMPWHSYDFDFASLGYVFPHLINKDFYQFEINDLDLTISPPVFKHFGSVTLKRLENETKAGKKAIKYEINGKGLDNRGGYVWFEQRTGLLLGFEIQKPDEPGYESGKLALEEIRNMSLDEWQLFKLAAISQP